MAVLLNIFPFPKVSMLKMYKKCTKNLNLLKPIFITTYYAQLLLPLQHEDKIIFTTAVTSLCEEVIEEKKLPPEVLHNLYEGKAVGDPELMKEVCKKLRSNIIAHRGAWNPVLFWDYPKFNYSSPNLNQMCHYSWMSSTRIHRHLHD